MRILNEIISPIYDKVNALTTEQTACQRQHEERERSFAEMTKKSNATWGLLLIVAMGLIQAVATYVAG